MELKSFVWSILLLFLSACGNSIDTKIGKMVSAKDQWQELSKGKNYNFSVQLITGHKKEYVHTFRVVDGKALNPRLDEFSTIRKLFDISFDYLKVDPNSVEIEYNPQYGYPTKIVFKTNHRSSLIVQNLEFE